MSFNSEHWLIEQSKKTPNGIAIVSAVRKLSYSELLNESLSTAARLFDLGVQQHDNVGILVNHDYNLLVLLNAIWFVGAIPVPLNTRLTNDNILEQISSAKISSVVISDELSQRFLLAGSVNKISFEKVLFSNNYAQQSAFRPHKFDLSNSALIMFTSGSSGKQKAVVHTFNNLLNSFTSLNNFVRLSCNDIWLASLSFYHIGGFMIPVRALLTGAAVAFPTSSGTDDIISTLDAFNPSHISLVPTTLQRMIEQNISPNKKLKCLFLGGGPSDAQLSSSAIKNGWPVVKVYGSTESCSMVAAMKPEDVARKPESSGQALPNCKIKIVDEQQNELPLGEIGEIVVAAGSVMKEYFNHDTNTKLALQDGWYYTGDYGQIDSDEFLFIESRWDDLIVTGGENVLAQEVQNTILQHDRVSDAFVFGVEDLSWGQMVCVAIVAQDLSEASLKNFLKQKLAGYKIPKQFYFVDEIPRNEMSKVDKKKLFEKIKLH